MLSKTRLLLLIPFILLPFLVVASLSSCQRSSPTPTETVVAGRQAVSVPCSPGTGCMTLDEFNPQLQLDGGWLTFSCDSGACVCDGGGACDATNALQAAVNTMVQNTNADFGTHSALPTVLYIAPGTYDISSTIFVQGAFGGAIYGDDPSTTIFNWTGPIEGTAQLAGVDGGTTGNAMFVFLDSDDTKLARVTLNGGLTSAPEADGGELPWLAGVQVLQSDPNTPLSLPDDGGAAANWSVFNLDFDDDVFKNLSFGLVLFSFGNSPNEFDEAPGTGGFFGDGVNYNFTVGDHIPVIDGNDGSCNVRRSSFENIYVHGISLAGQNTLDWLVEDDSFINCHRGLALGFGSSATVVNNLFFNNDGDDSVSVFNSTYTWNVLRGNVSVGADVFYAGNFVDHVDFSGNYVVLNPKAPDAGAGNPHCYAIRAQGNMLFLDNYIDGPSNDAGCSLENDGVGYNAIGLHNGDNFFSIAHGHNAYSGAAANFVTSVSSTFALDERCVGGDAGCPSNGSADTFGATSASAPSAAANAYVGWGSPTIGEDAGSVHRPTIAPKVTTRTPLTVPSACASSGSGSGCAAAITSLLGMQSSSCLLYFPSGFYPIDGQIEVPANLDVVIAGDGLATRLYWVGTGLDSYVFHAKAPSQATFRDFLLIVNGPASRPGGILVDSEDDVGGLVYIDNSNFALVKSGIQVAGLDNVLVRAEQVNVGLGGFAERGVDVIGGGGGYQDGGAQSSQTQGLFMLAGGLYNFSNFLTVRNWGKAVVVGSDSEGATQGMALNQSGYVTLDTGRFITGAQPGQGLYARLPNVVVESTFRGNVTFANMQTKGGVFSAAAHQAQVLALENSFGWQVGAPILEGPALPACSTVDAGDAGGGLTPLPALDAGFVEQTSTGAIQMGLQNTGECIGDAGDNNEPYNDTINSATLQSTFADTMFADLRHAPYAAAICPASCGQTQVRIHNVTMEGGPAGNLIAPTGFMRSGLRVQRSN